jgi:hypothetical protein
MAEESLTEIRPIEEYFDDPAKLPTSDTARWFIISRLRRLIAAGELPPTTPERVNAFLTALPDEFRFAVLIDLVPQWAALGASGQCLTLKGDRPVIDPARE